MPWPQTISRKGRTSEGVRNPQRLNARSRFAIDYDTVRALQRCREVHAGRTRLNRKVEVEGSNRLLKVAKCLVG